MTIKTTFAVILLLPFLTSCFDTVESEQIVGPYFIQAIDLSENMSIVYNEKEDFSGGEFIVSPTVYEIEWNNNFIVAKQHPNKDIEELVLNNFREHLFDSLQMIGQIENRLSISDSLSKLQLEARKQSGLFDKFKGKNKKEITVYYLINVKEKFPYSKMYLSKQELDSALSIFKVGKLDNRKYYECLDKECE